MAERFRLKSSPYKVGYGCPPKATRFRPGKSGNPKGRPKGPKSVGAVLYDILHRRIEVTENGATRRIPVLEVMLRRLANEAVRSDPRALKLMLSLMDRYADAPEVGPHLEEMLAEDREILTRFLRRPAGSAPGPERREQWSMRGGCCRPCCEASSGPSWKRSSIL
jgi:hypothetical protein